MGLQEPDDSTASNKDEAVPGRLEGLLNAYLGWLAGQPLAVRSRQAYAHQVKRYLAWLTYCCPNERWQESRSAFASRTADQRARTPRHARRGAARSAAQARQRAGHDGRGAAYKRHLKAVDGWKPASVNLALAALDSFYTQSRTAQSRASASASGSPSTGERSANCPVPRDAPTAGRCVVHRRRTTHTRGDRAVRERCRPPARVTARQRTRSRRTLAATAACRPRVAQ